MNACPNRTHNACSRRARNAFGRRCPTEANHSHRGSNGAACVHRARRLIAASAAVAWTGSCAPLTGFGRVSAAWDVMNARGPWPTRRRRRSLSYRELLHQLRHHQVQPQVTRCSLYLSIGLHASSLQKACQSRASEPGLKLPRPSSLMCVCQRVRRPATCSQSRCESALHRGCPQALRPRSSCRRRPDLARSSRARRRERTSS